MPAATSTFKLDWENLDRRFEIENTSKTWPRIKFQPCYRSLGVMWGRMYTRRRRARDVRRAAEPAARAGSAHGDTQGQATTSG